MSGKRYPDIVFCTRFGRLTWLSYDGVKAWSFLLCDCGTGVRTRTGDLRSGRQVSCGCHKREQMILNSTTHGLYRTPEYQSWRGMRERISNQNHDSYEYYGGRGITVAPEWEGEEGFQRFLEHIGQRPSPQHSVDRINANGNYEPGNVRWATAEEQANNRRPRRWKRKPQAECRN